MKRIVVLVPFLALLGFFLLSTRNPDPPQYFSPKPNAEYVSPGATIIVRYGSTLTPANLADLQFAVQGSVSGVHGGKTILADDQKTVIFKPDQPFTSGETVNVDVNSLKLNLEKTYAPLSYSFTVSVKQSSGSPAASVPPPPDHPPVSAFPNALTIPQDIPHYTVTKSAPDNGEGDIFVAPFYWMKSTVGSYLLILDSQGQLVYYQSMAGDYSGFDFKVQPNGLISYFSFKDHAYYLMDSHYQIVDKYTAGNGYEADVHDLQLLPDGNALLMVYDNQSVDLSKVVKDGKPDATVTGLVIQEIDPSKNVIFEWRSWDYFPLTSLPIDLTAQQIDAIHGNSLQLMNDGNLLFSSRTLSEITKIDLQTGEVLWRLGGKNSDFQFIEDDQPFGSQHDARQLPNGDITIFDNHGNADIKAAAPSRAVEYRLDEANKTATKVWEYDHNPPVFATYMGNAQRLENGNTFLDWVAPSTDPGYTYTNLTEVTQAGDMVFELAFDQPYVSYRAIRFPWKGWPTTLPALAAKADASGLTLGYSWNGATEVASYELFGGSSSTGLTQLDQQARTGFETQSHLSGLPNTTCYFQVSARDRENRELARSGVISTDPQRCPLQPS